MRRSSDSVGMPAEASRDPWPAGWSPEAVIRTLEPLAVDDRRERIREVVHLRLGSVTVLMDAPHDPHNGAAVLRTCEAFGVHVVHVVQRIESFLIARKVTRGTERWVDTRVHPSAEAASAALERDGFELVAARADGELAPPDLARVPKLALILGNERDGICLALERAARRSVRIPMRGFVESLNVSVAAAVLLAAATAGRKGDLSIEERNRLHARYLCQSVPRALEILAAARQS